MIRGYYMDHHVPAAVTAGLRQRGIACVTAVDDGASQLADPELLQRASDLELVLFSQDDDLLAIASDWLMRGQPFAGLVYGRQLSLTIGQAVQDLELIAQVLDPQDLQSRVMHIPL